MRILFILLLVSQLVWSQNTLKTKLNRSDVTVYLNQAQIGGDASFLLPKGRTQVHFTQLSSGVIGHSIQVNGLTGVTMHGMRFKQNYLENIEVSLEIRKLEEELTQLKKKKAVLEFELEGSKNALNLLLTNQKVNNEKQNLSVSELKEYAILMANQTQELKTQQYDLSIEIETLREKIYQLNRSLSGFKADLKKPTGEIILDLETDKSQTINLALSYVVNNAGWYPSYEIRAEENAKDLQFKYKAMVYQSTGQDWENVKLRLSTGNPSLDNNQPELNPQYLTFIQEYRSPIATRNKMNAAPQLEEMVVSDAGTSRVEVYSQEISKEQLFNQVMFNLNQKYTILSAQDAQTVTIDNFEVPATFSHYTVPLVQDKVYLTAEVRDWESYDLLPGEAQIYYSGSYAGKIGIDPRTTAEELLISLGVDPAVQIERITTANNRDKSFFGNMVKWEKGYKIKIRNQKQDAIQLKILDRIPVSRNSEISVEGVHHDAQNLDKQTGILTWEIELDSKQELEKYLNYEIKFPKSKILNINH